MAYQQEAIRRGGATPEAAACRRNPAVGRAAGWADLRRPASLLVARVLVCEYATLLAPGAAGGSGPARPREV